MLKGPLRSLHLSMLVWVVLPLLVLSALVVQLSLHLAVAPAQEERLKQDLELVARAVRLPIGESLANGEEAEIQNALNSVFSIGRVYGATVFDIDGNRIASVGTADSNLRNSQVAQIVVETGDTQERSRTINGRDLFSQFLPLYGAGRQINGLIQITRLESDFDQANRMVNLYSWGAWIIAAGLMVLIIIFGHYRGIGRHVQRLVYTMNRIEEGDRSIRVPATGPREMADISLALNRMLDGLDRAEREVREHQQSQRELNKRMQAQEKMAAIGRVASGIAHELGAPLSVISGRARRLSNHLGDEPRGHEQLQKIEHQVSRLNRIVRQLLDYCRPDGHAQVRLNPESVARAAGHDLSSEWPEHLNGIRWEIAPDLPSLVGNESRLVLALVNLMRNAMQAAHSQVRVIIAAAADTVRFVVEDDGDERASAPSETLLEPFYTSKPAGQGSGLGLAIVNNVALEHDGTLTLCQGEQGGFRAELSLPLPHLSQETQTHE
ncbi:MAG: HAMP domain-containing sensor histidine kinase [Saccharospirillum sp.]|uniref:sensor histidine kinase n=1 Tax=Saccharospirillum sp. TaxID=2033801 RepID=UPI003297F3DF